MRLALITVLGLLALRAYPQGGTTQVKASAVTMQSGTLQTALDVVDARMVPEYRLGIRQGDVAGIVSNYFADTVTLLLRNTLTSYTFPFTTNSIIFGPDSALTVPNLSARKLYMNSGWFSHLDVTGTVSTSWAYLYSAVTPTNMLVKDATVSSGRLSVRQALGDLICDELRTDLLGLNKTVTSGSSTIVDADVNFTGDVYLPQDAPELSLYTEPRLILNVDSNTISYRYDPTWVMRTSSGPKLYAGRYHAVWRTTEGSTLADVTLESRWAIPIARLGPPGLIFSTFESNCVPVTASVTNYSVKVYLSPLLTASRTITFGGIGDVDIVYPLPVYVPPPLPPVFPPEPYEPYWHYYAPSMGRVWGCSESNAVMVRNTRFGFTNLYESSRWQAILPHPSPDGWDADLQYAAESLYNATVVPTPELATDWWPIGGITKSVYDITYGDGSVIGAIVNNVGEQFLYPQWPLASGTWSKGLVKSNTVCSVYMGRYNGGFRAAASMTTARVYWGATRIGRSQYWGGGIPGYLVVFDLIDILTRRAYSTSSTDYYTTASIPICIYAKTNTAYWISNVTNSPGYWGAATTFTVTNRTIVQTTVSGTGNYADPNHGLGLPERLTKTWLGEWQVPYAYPWPPTNTFARNAPDTWLRCTGSGRYDLWRYPSGELLISDSDGNSVTDGRNYAQRFPAMPSGSIFYGPYDYGSDHWWVLTYNSETGRYDLYGTRPTNLNRALDPISLRDEVNGVAWPTMTWNGIDTVTLTPGPGYVDYEVTYKPSWY